MLDFGLAKRDTAAGDGSETSSPTAAPPTEPGAVMGTVGYMSPEQVRGQPADARSDIFSLGTVLYEMLSGRRAFARETAAETMTAVLREEPPDLATAVVGLPPALGRIVEHCLEKRPEERFQSARDLAFDLSSLSDSQVRHERVEDKPPGRRVSPRAIGAALVLLGALLGLVAGRLSKGASAPPARRPPPPPSSSSPTSRVSRRSPRSPPTARASSTPPSPGGASTSSSCGSAGAIPRT